MLSREEFKFTSIPPHSKKTLVYTNTLLSCLITSYFQKKTKKRIFEKNQSLKVKFCAQMKRILKNRWFLFSPVKISIKCELQFPARDLTTAC